MSGKVVSAVFTVPAHRYQQFLDSALHSAFIEAQDADEFKDGHWTFTLVTLDTECERIVKEVPEVQVDHN